MDGLALGVALTLATTGLLAYTGTLVLRRRVQGHAQLALRMFATWWFGAAAVLLLAGSHTMLALAGVTSIEVHLAITYLTAFPLAVALWSLLYYLIYIHTGRRAAIWPLSFAYLLFLGFELYYFWSLGPRTLETTAWSVRLARSTEPPSGLGALFGILLAAPVLYIVIAYGHILTRVRDPEQRFRARLTAGAFVVLFAPILVGFLVGWNDKAWFPLLYQVPGLLAASLIVLAHRPPRALQRRWSGGPDA